MKTKDSKSSANFEYSEFSGDISCPFCKLLLYASLEDRGVHQSDQEDRSALTCDHVGFWSFGSINEPNVNERWRKEMFLLARALRSGTDGEDEYGYQWQEALNYAIDEDGNIGLASAIAIPTFQVVVYKYFSYFPDYPTNWRQLNYLAVLLEKRKT